MSPKKARELRRVLDLPRLPKAMNEMERLQYRQAKARYAKMPVPARATFLDDVAGLKRTFMETLAARQKAPNATGILNPSST